MNIKHIIYTLTIAPIIALANPYSEAFTKFAIEKTESMDEQISQYIECDDAHSCTITDISMLGYGCLLNNLASLISLAGEYDAATWPIAADGAAVASFDITAELPFSPGDIDPEDYVGPYQINAYYSSQVKVLLAEITVKPQNADYAFMWMMVDKAYYGMRLLGLPNCSKM